MHRLDSPFVGARSAPVPTVALVVDRFDWHERELADAIAALGARVIPIRLPDCRIDSTSRSGVSIPGLDRLPDAVLVRAVPGGTFQAVTLRLGILHALRELGVPVWNDARAIERCVDKSMTSFLLARAGLPTPATWATELQDTAREIVRREAAQGPLVLKPLFGSQGRGLKLIRNENDLPAPAEVAGVYYLQRFVPTPTEPFRDLRLLVSRGRVIAAMARHASHWVTNIRRGATPVAFIPDATMRDLAVRAAAAVGADFAGADMMFDGDGRPIILEVNSMPGWAGLQRVASVNIASVLAADVIGALSASAAAGAGM
jgi:tetrahydromethanopterin:alpha-L-glutamate ligase